MSAVNGASNQFPSRPEDGLPLHATIPMAAVFLSIFSRCLTGSWFSPAATMVFGSLVRTLLRAALRILHCRELLEHAKHDINLPPRALSILCFACSSSCCPLGFVFAVCSLLNSSW